MTTLEYPLRSPADRKKAIGFAPLAVAATLFLTLMFASVPAAQAATYDLTNDLCGGGCLTTSKAGTVTLTQTGTTVDVHVVLDSGYGFAKTGAGDDQLFKFNSSIAINLTTGITIDAATTVPPTTNPLKANTGTFSGDGGGNFAYGISCPDCGNGTSSPALIPADFTFHVLNTNIANLTQPNDKGYIFAADVFGNGNTGLVTATGSTPPIPEPGTIYLFSGGLGLLGLGSLWRRKKARQRSLLSA